MKIVNDIDQVAAENNIPYEHVAAIFKIINSKFSYFKCPIKILNIKKVFKSFYKNNVLHIGMPSSELIEYTIVAFCIDIKSLTDITIEIDEIKRELRNININKILDN